MSKKRLSIKTCIYCQKDAATSAEHILQDSLGSNWKKMGIACKACNELFGRTIDKELSEGLLFFRNFLGIKNRYGNVQDLRMLMGDGKEPVQRNGKTGELVRLCKPTKKEKREGQKTSFEITTDLSKIDGIQAGVQRGVQSGKIKDFQLQVGDYQAIQPDYVHGSIELKLSSYVAMRKSIINYASVVLPGELRGNIQEEASKVYCYANNHNITEDEQYRLAKEMQIDGFPLIMTIPQKIKEEMLNFSHSAHALILTAVNCEAFGGIILFGHLCFGMKLFNLNDSSQFAHVAVFDPLTKAMMKDKINIRPEDIEYKYVDKEAYSNNLQTHVSNIMQKCLAMDFSATTHDALKPSQELINLFPMLSRKATYSLLVDKAAVLFACAFIQHGISRSLFRTGICRFLVEDSVWHFMELTGIYKLNEDSYCKFIMFIAGLLQEITNRQDYLAVIKRLQDIENKKRDLTQADMSLPNPHI